VASPDFSSLSPSTSSAVKTPDPYLLFLPHLWQKLTRLQKTKGDPDAPEPAAEGDIQIEYSSD
jgi:hypothetical protein